MKNRGRLLTALLLGVAFLAVCVLAHAGNKAPDKDYVIDSKDVFATKKKTPVVFSHDKHKAAKCTDCHHDFKDGKNVWQEGQEVKKCSECHKLQAQDKIVKLELAFHNQCGGCHKKMKDEGKASGPQKAKCADCHKKADK